MTTEKTYPLSKVTSIVRWYEKENKKLLQFKQEIERIMDNYIESDLNEEGILKIIEVMSIGRMLEENENIELATKEKQIEYLKLKHKYFKPYKKQR